MIKKIIPLICVLSVIFCFISCSNDIGNGTTEESIEEITSKELDVYLLAGQSNAAGQSVFIGNEQFMKTVANKKGYDKVLYYGECDGKLSSGEPTVGNVKAGLGVATNKMGPEVGMANVFANSKYYKGKKTAVVKYAASGTWLADVQNTFSTQYGTWTSPSMVERDGGKVTEKCGKLFDGLIDFTKQALKYYESQGYTPTLRGIIWSQGEADTGNLTATTKYKDNLKLFFDDLKSALSVSDNQKFCIVIPKIASTYNGGNRSVDTVRTKQQEFADENEGVFAVETANFIIKKDGIVYGSDSYHYNSTDMYEIGKLCGQKCLGWIND